MSPSSGKPGLRTLIITQGVSALWHVSFPKTLIPIYYLQNPFFSIFCALSLRMNEFEIWTFKCLLHNCTKSHTCLQSALGNNYINTSIRTCTFFAHILMSKECGWVVVTGFTSWLLFVFCELRIGTTCIERWGPPLQEALQIEQHLVSHFHALWSNAP